MFLFSLLDTVLLSLAHCMLIATYLFELAAHAQLHCYDIHTPRPLATGMLIEIVVRYLFNLLLLASSNCLLRQTISRAPPRFYFHKDQIMLIFSDDIDLSIPTAKVALQNTIALTDQSFCRQPFSCATKSLTCPFNWLRFIDNVVYQLSPTISYVALSNSVVKQDVVLLLAPVVYLFPTSSLSSL
jgi:hypothetical protein